MTLPPVVRVFFAIDLPPSVKDQVSAYIEALKKGSKTKAIRWTKPENLHITLQFLAEVKSMHLPALIDNVKEKLIGKAHPLSIRLGEVTLFPTRYHPRVIVLDVSHQEELATLSALVGEGIKATDYVIENRPFRGHLTLGRIKQPQAMNLNFLTELKTPLAEEMVVEEVALFRSEPQPEGSVYTVLERVTLKE